MPTIPTKAILSKISSFLDEFKKIDDEIKEIHREYTSYYDYTGNEKEDEELYMRYQEKSQLRMAAIDKAEELIKAFEGLDQQMQRMCMGPLLFPEPEGLSESEKEQYQDFTEISDKNIRIIETINRLESYFHSKKQLSKGQGLFDVSYNALSDATRENKDVDYDKRAARMQLKFMQMKGMAREQIKDYMGYRSNHRSRPQSELVPKRNSGIVLTSVLNTFLDRESQSSLGLTNRHEWAARMQLKFWNTIRSLMDDTLVIDRRLAMAIKDESNALAYQENGSGKHYPINFHDGHTCVKLKVYDEPYLSFENPSLDEDLLNALLKTKIINPDIQYFDYSTKHLRGAQCPIDITLLQECKNLKRLNLGSSDNKFSGTRDDTLYETLCRDDTKYTNIDELDLSGRNLEAAKIMDICRKFPNIRSLSLDGCVYAGPNVAFFPELLKNCKKLKKLSLKGTGKENTSPIFKGLSKEILETIPEDILEKAELDEKTGAIRDSILGGPELGSSRQKP